MVHWHHGEGARSSAKDADTLPSRNSAKISALGPFTGYGKQSHSTRDARRTAPGRPVRPAGVALQIV